MMTFKLYLLKVNSKQMNICFNKESQGYNLHKFKKFKKYKTIKKIQIPTKTLVIKKKIKLKFIKLTHGSILKKD